ncbi:hypothetical protein GCM10010174_23910 [Kutzneria viridogrisea]
MGSGGLGDPDVDNSAAVDNWGSAGGCGAGLSYLWGTMERGVLGPAAWSRIEDDPRQGGGTGVAYGSVPGGWTERSGMVPDAPMVSPRRLRALPSGGQDTPPTA